MSKEIENYVLQNIIGSGQYGKVYRAKNMENDQIVAIKVVKLEKFREVPKLHIQTLSKIDNQNIVKFIEMLKTQNKMYLICDFCHGDILEALLLKRKFLTEPETMKIFAQILNAFKSLVHENILDRDLKPSNILFHDQIVKVAIQILILFKIYLKCLKNKHQIIKYCKIELIYKQLTLIIRVLFRERSKIIFFAQMVSFLLEQNTVSAVQLHGSLSFSQKTAVIVMKLAQNQTEIIKKQLDPRRESKWEEFQGSNEYKQFNSTFQIESEQLLMNIESFKNKAQKSNKSYAIK